jgi:hypothetical protein
LNRDAVKESYRREDDTLRMFPNAARYEGTYFGLAQRIRRVLSHEPAGYIEINCFNDIEAELIAGELTENEKMRVKFNYLFDTKRSAKCQS